MTTVNNSLQRQGRKRPGAFMIYDEIKRLRLEHDYIKKAENVRRANEINEWYNREIQKPGNRKKLMIDRFYKSQQLKLDIQHFRVPLSV
ncbi:unnamed protein product [Nezara viridula]|uniref:Uncharacterized protein n=1 Tax=Nezara viridula TaxID=85310 RepID=A0A9P0HLN3_NEZVI|nr:unnamed protein product [Nezara viridula]CAH1404298.1 unnamed protein product [Nezara viridula]